MTEKYKISYEEEALQALEDIAFYFAQQNEYLVGKNIIERIKVSIDSLKIMPNRCVNSNFSPNVKKLSIPKLPYIAYFSIKNDTVYIMEILHGSRNQDYLYLKYKD